MKRNGNKWQEKIKLKNKVGKKKGKKRNGKKKSTRKMMENVEGPGRNLENSRKR